MTHNPCKIWTEKQSRVCGNDGVTYPSICHFNWYKRYCKPIDSDIRTKTLTETPREGVQNDWNYVNSKLTIIKLSEC